MFITFGKFERTDHECKKIITLWSHLKLKVVAEAKVVENNSEIARDYRISESMVRQWRRDQAKLFNGDLKMSAKRTTLGRFTPKYPQLDQQMLEWFSDQREQGEYSSLHVKSDKHFM